MFGNLRSGLILALVIGLSFSLWLGWYVSENGLAQGSLTSQLLADIRNAFTGWLPWFGNQNDLSGKEEIEKAKRIKSKLAQAGGASKTGGKSKSEKGVVQKTTQSVKQVGDAIGGIVGEQKQAAADTVSKTAETFKGGLQQQVTKVIEIIERTAGIDRTTGVGRDDNLSEIVIFVPLNQPVDFLVRNKSGQRAEQLINWGDGKVVKVSVEKDEEKTVRHTWQKDGDYSISFGSQYFLVRVK